MPSTLFTSLQFTRQCLKQHKNHFPKDYYSPQDWTPPIPQSLALISISTFSTLSLSYINYPILWLTHIHHKCTPHCPFQIA